MTGSLDIQTTGHSWV